MSDQRLRELERRWRETGLPQDEAAWLLERVRAGDVSRVQVQLASLLGHAGARAAVGVRPGADLADKLRRFGDDVLIRAGILAGTSIDPEPLASALRARARGRPSDPSWIDAALSAIRALGAPDHAALSPLADWALGGADPLASLLETTAATPPPEPSLWALPPEVRAAPDARARLDLLEAMHASGVLARAEYRRFVATVELGSAGGDFDP